MDKNKIFQNGSCWLRTDFHLHTKADKEFNLPADYNSNEFVKDYIAKLVEKNIGIGTITNHNKFDIDEFKALRKAAQKKDIFLLPGVELSLNDGSNGIHALIVFDPDNWVDKPGKYIEQFLVSAFEGVPNRENENTRCKYNLEALLKKLDEHRVDGRDSFIIMAHIEQNNGFLKELDGGRITQLAQNELFRKTVLGFQKLRTLDNVPKIKEWYGDNPIPNFVEGSDCKSFEEIGIMGTPVDKNGVKQEKECYIKVGDFNFESIKYALKDKDHRTSNKAINLTNCFIKSVSFVGGKYGGQTISFSREMNSIIGIRGSGKSAILEVLRDVLNINYGVQAADEKYKEGLIEYTLESGGKAIVEIESQGHNYRFEKIYKQTSNLFKDDQPLSNISIDAIINKPIYFGQKDLSNSGLDFEADLVKRLTGTKLDSIRSEIKEKEKDVRFIISKINKIKDLEQEKEEAESREKDIKHKLVHCP